MNNVVATTPEPITWLKSLLDALHATVAERARAEEEAHSAHSRNCSDANARFQQVSNEANTRHESMVRSADSNHESVVRSAEATHDSVLKRAESDREKVTLWIKNHLDEISSLFQSTVSFLGTFGFAPVSTATSSNSVVQFLDGLFPPSCKDFISLNTKAAQSASAHPSKPIPGDQVYKRIQACLTTVKDRNRQVTDLGYWLFHSREVGWLPLWISFMVVILLIVVYPAGKICGFWTGIWFLLILLLPLIGSSALCGWIVLSARNKVMQLLEDIFSASSKAHATATPLLEHANRACQELAADSAKRKEREIAESVRRRDREIAASGRRRDGEIARARAALESATQQAGSVLHRQLEQADRTWRQKLQRLQSDFQETQQICRGWFPEWPALGNGDWRVPASLPPALRFGEFRVELSLIPKGISSDRRFAFPDPLCPSAPALVPFPQSASLLVKGNGASKSGVMCLQAVMLRLLTVIPPGKARFTIIDPIGLGENFATFMHLADHDDKLVTSRIWTEPRQIEEQLEKITEHMEAVIQKYLRGQYKTIDEYNAKAGEVAEPYRFVVVANFPTKFSQVAAERLISIASVGPRCGVYLLVTLDTTQKLPRDFNLHEFEKHFVQLEWTGDRFVWTDQDFGKWPLRLDAPPPPELFVTILRGVGEQAKDGNRVEVPFEFIAPEAPAFWKGDSRSGVAVPLGRAGATARQCLDLGQGTKQHVLIAGKTGSGKSTLLHAIITNLALIYSPDEVELYLVDFKKGVEFKTYATHTLPHARVVAIESEREFGLSVLQRLDGELKRRGDAFRAQGVQDIATFRAARPAERCPRILLIVDEFQEFFVEGDSIQGNASMLLERLVRQGRAFGIHVILGSQTLYGTHLKLTTATVSQMAVRIALQCSATDSTLILSDNNKAARLLSRPGEAIYNDAHGLEEGNSPFQVVWLPDDRRVAYLQKLQELARLRHFTPPSPQIVFEGYTLADIGKNHLLNKFLYSTKPHPAPLLWKAWLGEALSIKDPTCADFRPQGGSNLLVVGQEEEIGIGVVFASMVSIVAQNQSVQRPATAEGVRVYLLDGTPADSPYHDALAGLVKRLPLLVHTFAPKGGVAAINEIMSEINDHRTKAGGESNFTPWFLIVHGLQHFRDFRRPEESPLLRRSGEKDGPNPAKDFQSILREGPAVRIHTVLWCDSLTNLNRTIDRQGLREFEMRVVLQMAKADSHTLIGEPWAAELGSHRAYFFAEQRGTLEKFRPYGIPDTEWVKRLERVQAALRSKS